MQSVQDQVLSLQEDLDLAHILIILLVLVIFHFRLVDIVAHEMQVLGSLLEILIVILAAFTSVPHSVELVDHAVERQVHLELRHLVLGHLVHLECVQVDRDDRYHQVHVHDVDHIGE